MVTTRNRPSRQLDEGDYSTADDRSFLWWSLLWSLLSAIALTQYLGITNATEAPVKTIESYWPYATTVFDYVKRSMPFMAPGSLSDDEVYSVVAYILGEANILPKNASLDATSLPKVQMPNRDGFVPDPRPEIGLYR